VSIVVDNASSISDFVALKVYCQKCKNVRLIGSPENLGYFGGLNTGLLSLETATFDYIVIGNNDLTFDQNFLKELSTRSYPEDVLVIAPNVITRDGYNQNPHCVTRVSAFRKFLYQLYYINYGVACLLTWGAKASKVLRGGRRNEGAYKSQCIHMGIGACYILSKSFFRHYSKLDDSVFLYGEEALLAGQVMAVGGKIFYDSNLIVSHAESATLSKLPSKTTYNFAKASYPKYRPFL